MNNFCRIQDSINHHLPYPEAIGKTSQVPLCDFFNKEKGICELIIIHHGDEIAEKFYESLNRSYVIRKIICIPYSSTDVVIDRLAKKFDVVVPKDLNSIQDIVVKSISSSDAPVIIVDIGAYTSNILDFLQSMSHVRGVVDITTHSYWTWYAKEIEKLPVISIARSKIKATENPVTGKNIINSTTFYLQENFQQKLNNKSVLLIGFGGIGQHVARYLQPIVRKLIVHDKDPVKYIEAGNIYNTTEDWSDVDIVFCITGKEFSITEKELIRFKSGVIFMSGSSKRVEFDFDSFARLATEYECTDAFFKYVINGKELFFANKGEPINFRHVFLPGYALEPAFAATIKCIQKLDNGYQTPGLVDMDINDEYEIAKVYLDIYR